MIKSKTQNENVVRLLSDLVMCNSTNPSGEELSSAKVLEKFLLKVGFVCEIIELSTGRVNLIATRTFGSSGPTLLLNSHLDVVPAGNGWDTDPFVPEIMDGKLYGRGSADAKGALASMAVACANLSGNPNISGKLIFSAVSDEEGGSTGARRLVDSLLQNLPLPNAVIVGEPTEMKIVSAHKGSLRPIIRITGKAAHAAAPHNGINAIEAAGRFINHMNAYAIQLESTTHSLVGSPTCTAVLIQGGEAPNAVPETVEITFDRRLIPEESNASVEREIKDLVLNFNVKDVGFASIYSFAPTTGGPSETSPNEPFIQICQAVLLSLGSDEALQGLQVNCDMTHFRKAGIPTIVTGPGSLEVMHAANEHISIIELSDAVAIYQHYLEKLLEKGATWHK
jgi:succinyl-diaminopimelate desuccinylase